MTKFEKKLGELQLTASQRFKVREFIQEMFKGFPDPEVVGKELESENLDTTLRSCVFDIELLSRFGYYAFLWKNEWMKDTRTQRIRKLFRGFVNRKKE